MSNPNYAFVPTEKALYFRLGHFPKIKPNVVLG